MLVPALVQPARVWFDGDVVKARDELLLRALAATVDDFKGRIMARHAEGDFLPSAGDQ